jgi:hypothetical protein
MSRVSMQMFADYVVEGYDSDNEFYNFERLGEIVVDELERQGYLMRCETCDDEHGWSRVYYLSDQDCPNASQHGDAHEEHEYCEGCEQCKDCYGCSCSRADRQAEEAWA